MENFIFAYSLILFISIIYMFYRVAKVYYTIIATKEGRNYTNIIEEYFKTHKNPFKIDFYGIHFYPFSFLIHQFNKKTMMEENEEIKYIFRKKYILEFYFWLVLILGFSVLLILNLIAKKV